MIIINVDSLPILFLAQIISAFSRFLFNFYVISKNEDTINSDFKEKTLDNLRNLKSIVESNDQIKLATSITYEL